MRVEQLMSKPAITCGKDGTLNTAARLMWDHDCGAVPVVGDEGTVVGVVTDRDICMAAYTQGKPLKAIPVSQAMAGRVVACPPDQSIDEAERLMAEKGIRRLPVVDADGHPVGLLSINDVARNAAASRAGNRAQQEVAKTLAAICQPRPHGDALDRSPALRTARELALTAF